MVGLIRVALLLAAAMLPCAAGASDDHGGGSTMRVIAPRTEARLGDKQVVIVYANRRLALFLEAFSSGRPTTGATLEAMVNFLPHPLTEAAPGVYLSEVLDLPGGRNDVEVAYDIAGEQGTVSLVLAVGAAATVNAAASMVAVAPPMVPGWAFALAGAIIYVGVAGLFYVRSKGRADSPQPPSRAHG